MCHEDDITIADISAGVGHRRHFLCFVFMGVWDADYFISPFGDPSAGDVDRVYRFLGHFTEWKNFIAF